MRIKVFAGFVFGLSMTALLFAGCSGGGTTAKSCSVTADCDKGTICVNSSCSEVKCTTIADCESGVCDTIAGVCSPKECSVDPDCNDSSLYCDGGICRTKVLSPDASQDVANPDISGESVTDNGGPVVQGDDCKECASAADCSDGYDCVALSTGKACLKKCTSNGECVSGYICYAASTAGKNCVPPSYKCVKCATEGCPDGKVCDLSGGTCVDKIASCGPCNLDWECGIGNRCYRKDMNSKGICVPECKTVADCPQPQDKYTCQADAQGTMMCQPTSLGVCCPPEKPAMLADGTCVECATSADCTNGGTCDTTTHTCGSAGCTTGQKMCSDDNQCHQCCEKADCPATQDCIQHQCTDSGCTNPGEKMCSDDNACHQCCDNADCTGGKTCQDHACVNTGDPCGGCSDPNYPYCVEYQGNPVCAACDPSDASSCKSPCLCDPNSFSCLNQDGSVCGGTGGPQKCGCTSDTDCVDASGQGTFKCAPEGYCYDPSGSCDGTNSCCDASSGSKCFDLMSLLFGGMGGIPGMPQGGTMMGVCGCDNGAKCPGGTPCFPLSTLCAMPLIGQMMCPGGSLPPNSPQNICKDPMSLLGGSGI